MWDIEFLIVQQKQWKHWFFPKWHVEQNESEEETALREIYEEAWLYVNIISWFRETFPYVIGSGDIEKTVVFFLCEYISWSLIISDELSDCAWFNYWLSLQRLIQNNSREVLKRAYKFLSM